MRNKKSALMAKNSLFFDLIHSDAMDTQTELYIAYSLREHVAWRLALRRVHLLSKTLLKRNTQEGRLRKFV
jgi:hypothetical protein